MAEFDECVQGNMDVVLEEICAALPNGGDHGDRKFVAEHLIQCARGGKTSLAELTYIGRRALLQLRNKPKSA